MPGPVDPDLLRNRLTPTRPPLVPEIAILTAGSGSGLARLVGRTPYWAFAWPGGCLLARYLLDNPGIARGRRALDIGSGCGIVAIAAAKAGATVTAIDSDPLAAVAAAMNGELNEVGLAVETADPLGSSLPAADLILVGDVFYEARLARRVCRFLDRCRSAGTDVFVGDIGRAHLPRARLRQLAAYGVADFGSPQERPGAVYEWLSQS